MSSFSGLLGLTLDDLEFRWERNQFSQDPDESLIVEMRNADTDPVALVQFGSKKSMVNVEEIRHLLPTIRLLPGKKLGYWAWFGLPKAERGRGFGLELANIILDQLGEHDVQLVLLQALDSTKFWRKVGFRSANSYYEGLPLMYALPPLTDKRRKPRKRS